MTHEQLEAIRERTEKATKGPWVCGAIPNAIFVEANDYKLICGKESDIQADYENAVFIANAREDIPALLAEVARLHEEITFIAHVDGVTNAYDADFVPISVKSWAERVLNGGDA